MLHSRHVRDVLSLTKHIPGPAVLAAANIVIACSIPRRQAAAQDASSSASVHTASTEDKKPVQRAPAPRQPSAASYSGWRLRPFHSSAAAGLAESFKGDSQEPQEAVVRHANGDSGAGSTGDGALDAAADGDGEEGYGSDETGEAIEKAFDGLIKAAYELVQEGKPMEAEFILREGAKEAEKILGEGCTEVAPLYDQLAMISFFHDRVEEAKEPALRAYNILKEHEGDDSPATAIAGVRYAILLLASGQPREAIEYFEQALASLESALDFLKGVKEEDQEQMQEIALAAAKFEVGRAESVYYRALCRLAMGPKDAEGIKAHEAEMVEGVRVMGQHIGPQQPLVGAALREHHRLVEAALEADDLEQAERLYEQQIRLHQAYDPDSEHVAMLGYQAGTLQYVMGHYEGAVTTLERSLHTVRTAFEEAEDYLITVKHRLAMAYGALGQRERARAMLQEVSKSLVDKLGEDNPITHELNFMLCLLEYEDLVQQGAAGDAGRKQQLVSEMQSHIDKLASYGEDHMLVKKAQEQLANLLAE